MSKKFIKLKLPFLAYSLRKLSSRVNNKCTCLIPKGVIKGGYCYAQDKNNKICRPCDLGIEIKDIQNTTIL